MRLHTGNILIIGWMSAILTGCGSGEIFYRPSPAKHLAGHSQVYMLNELADGTDHRATGTRPAEPAATQPATTTRPAIAQRPEARLAYSTPSGAHRQLLLVGPALKTASLGELRGAGREAGEAQLAGGLTPLSAATGAPGLGAPQPLTNNVVVGQDGLQPGIAIGFGPVLPNNLFTRNVFPISGPGGACEALRRAGFPNHANCPIR